MLSGVLFVLVLCNLFKCPMHL